MLRRLVCSGRSCWNVVKYSEGPQPFVNVMDDFTAMILVGLGVIAVLEGLVYGVGWVIDRMRGEDNDDHPFVY